MTIKPIYSNVGKKYFNYNVPQIGLFKILKASQFKENKCTYTHFI